MQFRGPSVVRHTWTDPESPAAATDGEGWLATGDLGYLDEDGDLFLVDRKKEMIIRGGYNVYPREVEEALYAHPAVVEAAVVGIPHELLGEDVAAFVVLAPGRSSRPRSFRRGRRSASRRTSTRATSCCSTSCRRGRRGRSSSGASICTLLARGGSAESGRP